MELRTILFIGALSSAFAVRPALAQDRPGSPSSRDPAGRDTANVMNDTTGARGPNVVCDSGQVATTTPTSPTTGSGTISPRPCATIIRDTVPGAGIGRDTTGGTTPTPSTGTSSNPGGMGTTGGVGGTPPSGNPPTGGTVSSPPPSTPR